MGISIYKPEYQAAYYKENEEKKKTYQREYRLKNIERVKAKDRAKHLRRNYGITPEQYEMLMVKQGRVCAICRRPERMGHGTLSVDHNHDSGEIRGLLCNWCNAGIGFIENETFFESAKKYLER